MHHFLSEGQSRASAADPLQPAASARLGLAPRARVVSDSGGAAHLRVTRLHQEADACSGSCSGSFGQPWKGGGGTRGLFYRCCGLIRRSWLRDSLAMASRPEADIWGDSTAGSLSCRAAPSRPDLLPVPFNQWCCTTQLPASTCVSGPAPLGRQDPCMSWSLAGAAKRPLHQPAGPASTLEFGLPNPSPDVGRYSGFPNPKAQAAGPAPSQWAPSRSPPVPVVFRTEPHCLWAESWALWVKIQP